MRDYLRTKLGTFEHEVFASLLLDSQNRLVEYAELFRGTLAQTSVYPREVVKIALTLNDAAMIFSHNHPSGVAEPSRAGELLTQMLKQALSLVEVRVLDHFIVAGDQVCSFAERGLLTEKRAPALVPSLVPADSPAPSRCTIAHRITRVPCRTSPEHAPLRCTWLQRSPHLPMLVPLLHVEQLFASDADRQLGPQTISPHFRRSSMPLHG